MLMHFFLVSGDLLVGQNFANYCGDVTIDL